jgi:hypothetical protein
MTNSINQIIETAVKLDSKILEDYLYEMQSQSNLDSKVFFGLLKTELKEIKKRDKEEIDRLEKSGLILFYKYHLLEIIVDMIFEGEFLRRDITPKMARVLGYDIKPSQKKSSKETSEIHKATHMKFNEIDFHIELVRACNEPPGNRINYLLMLRNEAKYKKEPFIVKIKDAFKNIQNAWENEFNFKKAGLLNPESISDITIPIFHFREYPGLENFSMAFNGYINKQVLEELSELVISLNLYLGIKEIKKGVSELSQITDQKQTNNLKHKESNGLKNKFNLMPFEEVRSHFLPLIKIPNPKKIIWMTNEDFETFLRRSFGGEKDLEKPKINMGHGAKYAIVKLFYEFYNKCQIEDYNQTRNREPFLNLLKDAFLTKEFDDLDTSNFKASNSQYEWN